MLTDVCAKYAHIMRNMICSLIKMGYSLKPRKHKGSGNEIEINLLLLLKNVQIVHLISITIQILIEISLSLYQGFSFRWLTL